MKYIGINKYFLHFALCSLLFALCEQSSALEQKADISTVGMDMFTTAYQWETANASGYNNDALAGFTDKLNKAILADPALSKLGGKGYCEGCTEIIKKGFEKNLIGYLQSSTTSAQNRDYINLIGPYLDPRLSGKIDANTAQALNSLVGNMVEGIGTQVQEQMKAFQEISSMGQYYDGDTKNSPYDLIDDMKRIDDIFLRQTDDTGDYKNTAQTDARGLITGRFAQGEWAEGKNYDLNLLGDIDKALGKKNGGGGENNSTSTKSGKCETGFCMTVDIITSSHYIVGGGGSSRGSSSFQGLFEEGLNWVTKNGDKRNLGCQSAPAINNFGSNTTRSFKLSKFFSGLMPHILWKTPPFLRGFFNHSNSGPTKAETAKTDEKKQIAETNKRLNENFSKLGINYEKPSDLQGTPKQAYEYYAVENSAKNSNMTIVANAVELAQKQYENSLIAKGKGVSDVKLHTTNVASIDHVKQGFESNIASPIRAMSEFSRSMNSALKTIYEKPDCINS